MIDEKNKKLIINFFLLLLGVIITIAGVFFIETNKRSIFGQVILLLGLLSLVYSVYRIISSSTKN
jgi:uncharacterized membrane protein